MYVQGKSINQNTELCVSSPKTNHLCFSRLDCTCSLLMISDLVMATRSASSTAKAGKEMTDRRPASISLEVEALGSMEHRMDWGKTHRWAEQKEDEQRRCWGGWGQSQRYLTMFHFIGQNMDDWLRPSMGTKKIQLIYGLQSCLQPPPPYTQINTHIHEPLHVLYNTFFFWSLMCTIMYNNKWSMWLPYLCNSYRAAIKLGDALVGLITSLPHPIILQGGKRT